MFYRYFSQRVSTSCFLFGLSLTPVLKAQVTSNELVFSEVLAANETAFIRPVDFVFNDAVDSIEQLPGSGADAIELQNLSANPIDISGFQLTDSPGTESPYRFPAGTVIPANGFIVLTAFGILELDGTLVGLNADFRLNAGGETLQLSDAAGTLIQELTIPRQRTDISYGRRDDGSYGFYYTPTLGSANDVTSFSEEIIRRPQTDQESGLYPVSSTLSVNLESEPGTVIHFTTDGTQPTTSSPVYSSSLSLNSTTVLKSIAVESATGFTSDVASRSFIFTDVTHELPVVIITADDLIVENNPAIEQYTDFDLDGRVRFDFLETDGSLPISQYAAFAASGAFSRGLPFFNGKIRSRSAFGPSTLEHNFFPEKEEQSYTRLLIRNTSQDYSFMRMRDGVVSRIISNDNIVDVEHEGFRPAVVYLNGEFLGQVNIREDNDRTFAKQYLGFEGAIVRRADFRSIRNSVSSVYQSFATLPNRNAPDAIQRLDELIKIDEAMIDSVIRDAFEVFEERTFWLSLEEPQKLRTNMHDYDFAFGLGSAFGNNDPEQRQMPGVWSELAWDEINFPMDENTRFWHDATQSVAAFLQLFGYEERVLEIIDNTADEIRGEMQRTIDAYASRLISTNGTHRSFIVSSMQEWDDEVAFAKDYTRERLTGALDALATTYGFSILEANIASADTLMGDVSVQGYKVTSGRENGRYFADMPLRLRALPKPGYSFTGWQGDVPVGSETNPYIEVSLNGTASVTATFAPNSLTLAVSEIFYNPAGPAEDEEFIEVVNYGSDEIDLSGVSFTDGISYTFPDGTSLAAGAYLIIRNGEYEGALNNGGETIEISNLAGEIIETFTYSDDAPWPEIADGDGYSLVRIEPGNDDPNAPQAWRISALLGGNPAASDALPLTDNTPEGLLEYAFGATTGNTLPLFELSKNTTGNLDLNFSRVINADAVSVTLFSSPDLSSGSWAPVPLESIFSTGSPQAGSEFFSTEILTTEPTQFYRLEVEER